MSVKDLVAPCRPGISPLNSGAMRRTAVEKRCCGSEAARHQQRLAARSSRSMEQARATASDLPAGQIVEAAALDIDNTSSVFPVRFDQRHSDAVQPYDAR
ncbi:hypothetical protein G6F57_018452 [Rhizopus arrhizus]|nr:hypothetical protein G6F59_015266 [Rhizopus arrhizus]KAG1442270.1 hypothetical protein G6F57_018452 [Rhizopus arrhizus]